MSDHQESEEIPKKGDTIFSMPKPWTRYLAEFLLLFLAVFLGFLAENYREKISEEHQAKELARNLYDELLADSTIAHITVARRNEKDIALTEFINYVLEGDLQRPSQEYVQNFYRGLMVNSRFYPRDVILEQLKNSGSLRYFQNKELQHLIGTLSVAISNVRVGNNFELEFNHTQLIPFIIQHNDQRFFDELTQNGSISISQGLELYDEGKITALYSISNLAEFNRESVSNMLGIHRHAHRGATSSFYASYIDVNKKLLAELRKEYKFK